MPRMYAITEGQPVTVIVQAPNGAVAQVVGHVTLVVREPMSHGAIPSAASFVVAGACAAMPADGMPAPAPAPVGPRFYRGLPDGMPRVAPTQRGFPAP
jgi:hypothetical protein